MGFGDGSGIIWTICKRSTPHSRQITTPTTHHSTFTGLMLFLTPNQQCQSTEGIFNLLMLLLLLHLFNGLFSRTTWVSQYQKSKTSLYLNEARDNGVVGGQWHQLDHMQTIGTWLQTDNHMLFMTPNQQCQSTEGLKAIKYKFLLSKLVCYVFIYCH